MTTSGVEHRSWASASRPLGFVDLEPSWPRRNAPRHPRPTALSSSSSRARLLATCRLLCVTAWRGRGSLTPSAAPRPPPGRLAAATLPPRSSTTRLTIDSPSPVPPRRRVKNGSKARASVSASKPAPVLDRPPTTRDRRAVSVGPTRAPSRRPARGAGRSRQVPQTADAYLVQRKHQGIVLERDVHGTPALAREVLALSARRRRATCAAGTASHAACGARRSHAGRS